MSEFVLNKPHIFHCLSEGISLSLSAFAADDHLDC